MLASERRHHILEQLRLTGQVHVADLAETLDVSRMTIHRDLYQLAAEGLVQKVFGGAIPVSVPPDDKACALCHMDLRPRTAFVVQEADGSQWQACCPHCGLLLVHQHAGAILAALTADFLHGRMINVRMASYLVNPDLHVCCTPSILSFENRSEAVKFQTGFSGDLMSWDEVQDYVRMQTDLSTQRNTP